MKKCLVCGATAPALAHACDRCGSADWQPVAPIAPKHEPISPVPSSRDKRNKV